MYWENPIHKNIVNPIPIPNTIAQAWLPLLLLSLRTTTSLGEEAGGAGESEGLEEGEGTGEEGEGTGRDGKGPELAPDDVAPDDAPQEEGPLRYNVNEKSWNNHRN